jgi:hypothetical protein
MLKAKFFRYSMGEYATRTSSAKASANVDAAMSARTATIREIILRPWVFFVADAEHLPPAWGLALRLLAR